MDVLELDGSAGEGGGQILRTTLALSMVTGRPFRIHGIRARRRKPGLLRQHLTAVRAAKEISEAGTRGDELGSLELEFSPGSVRAGEYHFSVGTAGSTTLVFQAILPALMLAGARSRVAIEGGTHNPFAPPFDFLERAFLPLLRRMGPDVRVRLERPGFAPTGGGRIEATIDPVPRLEPLELLERGRVQRKEVRALVADLPREIGEREVRRVRRKLSDHRIAERVVTLDRGTGPGNALLFEIESDHVTEMFTAFGRRGVPSERVADELIDPVRRHLRSEVPVGEHLADQLLLPLALAGSGAFRTGKPSQHTLTNLEVARRFLPVELDVRETSRSWRIECGRTG